MKQINVNKLGGTRK